MSKVPPNDLDAERAVLAQAMLSESALLQVAEQLTTLDWYSPAHRLIYAAILALREDNTPVDLATVAGRLRDDGQLLDVGGAKGIARIVDETPACALAPQVRRVRELARLRRMIATAQQIALDGYDAAGNPQEWTENAQRLLSQALQTGQSEVMVPLRSALTAFIEEVQRGADGKPVSRLSTGSARVDKVLGGGLWPGEVTLIAARPGMGKSAAILQIALGAAHPGGELESGDPRGGVAFFSLEMVRTLVAARALAQQARVNLTRLRLGDLSDTEWGDCTSAARDLAPLALYLDDTPAITIRDVRLRSLALDRRLREERGFGLSLVVLDYMQLIRAGEARLHSREEAVSEVSRGCKCLAMELARDGGKGHVLAAAQLNRESDKARSKEGKPRRPYLSDLRESGALEQDADNVIFLWRWQEEAEWIIAKQRNGQTGTVSMRWIGQHTRFQELPDDPHEMEDLPDD